MPTRRLREKKHRSPTAFVLKCHIDSRVHAFTNSENATRKGTRSIEKLLEMDSCGGDGVERDAFFCSYIRMHSDLAMTLGAVGPALLDPPGIEDRPGRIEGCVHGVICPRLRIVPGAFELARPVGAKVL